jgi:TPR repeat protein
LSILSHPNSNFVFWVCCAERVIPPPAAAIGWFQRAADRMHMPAMWQLALVYNSGIGTAPDPARAMHWYRHDGCCMIDNA